MNLWIFEVSGYLFLKGFLNLVCSENLRWYELLTLEIVFLFKIEPACSLNRERLIEYSLCIIFQETRKEILRCTDTVLSTLINATNLSQTFKDPNNRTAKHIVNYS